MFKNLKKTKFKTTVDLEIKFQITYAVKLL